jgi:hypothetical protein
MIADTASKVSILLFEIALCRKPFYLLWLLYLQPCICLQRTLGTYVYVANRYLAMADFIAGSIFTQPLAGNGRLLRLRYSGF